MSNMDRLGWTAGTAISTFGICVGVRTNNDAVLRELSERFPPGWTPSRNVYVDRIYSVLLGRRHGGSRTRRYDLLFEDTERLARTMRIDEVLARFENSVQMLVASSARRRIFVHAGVVGWRGRAILMPGRSFSGKTTLVSAFLKAGATYYSDEYAVLDERGRVHPYPRALSLRGEAKEPPRRCTAEAFGSVAGTKPLPVAVVAAFRYERGARWQPRRLSPGQAALALLSNTVPVRHAPERALRTVRNTVENARVVRGRRGEAEETAELLLKMVG